MNEELLKLIFSKCKTIDEARNFLVEFGFGTRSEIKASELRIQYGGADRTINQIDLNGYRPPATFYLDNVSQLDSFRVSTILIMTGHRTFKVFEPINPSVVHTHEDAPPKQRDSAPASPASQTGEVTLQSYGANFNRRWDHHDVAKLARRLQERARDSYVEGGYEELAKGFDRTTSAVQVMALNILTDNRGLSNTRITAFLRGLLDRAKALPEWPTNLVLPDFRARKTDKKG